MQSCCIRWVMMWVEVLELCGVKVDERKYGATLRVEQPIGLAQMRCVRLNDCAGYVDAVDDGAVDTASRPGLPAIGLFQALVAQQMHALEIDTAVVADFLRERQHLEAAGLLAMESTKIPKPWEGYCSPTVAAVLVVFAEIAEAATSHREDPGRKRFVGGRLAALSMGREQSRTHLPRTATDLPEANGVATLV